VKVEVAMLLTVDIGNTKISFGIFAKNRLVKKFDIATGQYSLKRLERNLGKLSVTAAITCSVVPDMNRIVRMDLRAHTGKKPIFVGQDIIVPIKNKYRFPKQVGQDRLVTAYAASKLYGYPALVVDAGTAITLDVISGKKAYLGGMIVPGLKMSLDALYKDTALLPYVQLSKPNNLIGTDTKSSILSGVVFGLSVLVEGMVNKLKAKFGASAIVVGTGGSIHFLSRYCKIFTHIDPDLTLKGLSLIYSKI
ncbi:MAG: type III pantothenate kinase, partial [Candidatus Omnitrophota bacterium]